MSLPTRIIMQGLVQSVDTFKGVAKATGEPFQITTATIIGNPTMGAVQLPDDLVRDIVEGLNVTLLCEVGVYRNDDQLQAIRWLDRPAK